MKISTNQLLNSINQVKISTLIFPFSAKEKKTRCFGIVLIFLFVFSEVLQAQYSYNYSDLCTNVQANPPYQCTNSNVYFSLSENVHSWVQFTDVSEAINIRHQWFTEQGAFVWEFLSTDYCCGTLINVSARQASLLGAGNFYVEIQVSLASDPTNFTTIVTNYFTVFPSVCSVPTGLSVTGSGHTWVALSWTDPMAMVTFEDDYQVQYKKSSSGTWLAANTGGGACPEYTVFPVFPPDPFAVVYGLEPCTSYDFRVSKFCKYTTPSGNYSGYSAPITEITGECGNTYFTTSPARYCVGFKECTVINSIDFSNVSEYNTSFSELNGYKYLTTPAVNLSKGQPYALNMNISGNSFFNHYLGVWIDFDKDGQFESAEKVVTDNGLSLDFLGEDVYYEITVPQTAANGTTRMRIIARTLLEPQPHAGVMSAGGFVEDLNVIISNGGPAACYPAATSLANGRLLQYSFDGTTSDETGTNNGIAYGAPLFDSDRSGSANSAIRFDGVNDSILTTNAVTERSVAFWFKAGSNSQMPIFQGGSSNNQTGKGYLIGMYAPGGLPGVSWDTVYGLAVDFNNRGVYVPFATLNSGWRHIAVSWDGAGSTIKVAIDGTFYPGYLYNSNTGGFATALSTQPFNLGIVPAPATAVKSRLGTNSGAQIWNTGLTRMNGWLDDFRIYNRSVTDDEMQILGENYIKKGAVTGCGSQQVTLTCPIPNATSYQWKNVATGQVLGTTSGIMPTFGISTSVSVEVQTAGCTYRDTVMVDIPPVISMQNITSSGLTGSFILSGGLPQIDGSNYASVTMTQQGNPVVTGTLSTVPFTHGETVTFTVPEEGNYIISVTDGGGCTATSISYVDDCGTLGCSNLVTPSPGSMGVSINTVIKWSSAVGCPAGYLINIFDAANNSNIYSNFQPDTLLTLPQSLPPEKTILVRVLPFHGLLLDLDGDGTFETVVYQDTAVNCQQDFWFTTGPAPCTLPQANFTSVTQNNTLTFTNTSTNATSYHWDFGDGQTSSQTNPTHNYTSSGYYTVTLIANSLCGADTLLQLINTAPTADFTIAPETGCAALAVQFTNTSSSNAVAFQWQFPGGNPATSNLANPMVVYLNPGIYSATLTATNSNGSDQETKTDLIVVSNIPSTSFTYSNTGLTVNFINTSTDATSYLWNFGDGQTSVMTNPVHTYSSPGTYQVCLESMNMCGSLQTCQSVIITSGGSICNPISDSLELVKLYNSTNGPGWVNNTNWLVPGQPVSGWYGITTNTEGCVVCIDLDGKADCTIDTFGYDGGNNLVGSLVNLNLPSIQSLFLSSNDITGEIPNFNLPNLIKFSCYANQLNDTIPDFNLPNLEIFDCHSNNLSGPIPNFQNIVNLREFFCGDNQLSDSIPDFSNLSNLIIFICNGNQLNDSIPNFSNLPNLQILDCSSNKLSGSIPDFSNLSNLTTFKCHVNELSGNIPDFSNLPNLKIFWCWINQLSGSIPDFSNLPNLAYLWCMLNQLSGNIPNFEKLPKLQIVSCSFNRLSGNLPNFQFLISLNRLSIGNNLFTFGNILPTKSEIDGVIFSNCGNPGPSCEYFYAPQDSIFTDTLITRSTGQSLTIDLGIDAAVPDNIYTWHKTGEPAWTPPPGNNINSNQLIFNNLKTTDSGVYYVDVTNPGAPALTLHSRSITLDVQGCSVAMQPQITGPVTLCSGTATLQVSGNYTGYLWSNNAVSSAVTVSQTGTYTVTVTDSNTCTGTVEYTISSNAPAPTPAITGPVTLCPDMAVLQAGAFTQYSWSNNATTATITVAQNGAFTVTVTDSNGCTGTAEHSVNGTSQPPAPAITGPSALCSGTATLQITGNYAAYSWSNNAAIPAITVTQSNTYTVTVTDNNGCTGTDTQTVGASVPAPTPSISISAQQCNTSATLSAGVYPIYLWSGGQNTPAITTTTAGAYAVTVTDANGCTGTSLFNYTPAPVLNITASTTNPVSCTTPDGSIDIAILTGTMPFQYIWSNGATTQDISSQGSGIYMVTVTDAANCTQIYTSTLIAPGAPVVTPQATATTCQMDNGSISLNISGVIGTPTYTWSNGATTQGINDLPPGQYTVTVTAPNMCTSEVSATIAPSGPPPQPVITGDNIICGNTTLLTVNNFNNYLWSNGATTNSITVSATGFYEVTVTDAGGCTGTATHPITAVVIPPTPEITGPSALCGGAITLSLSNNYPQILWSGGATSSSIMVSMAGNYAVTVTDAQGCTGTDSFTVSNGNTLNIAITSSGSTSICAGDTVTLSTPPVAGYSYQWQLEDVDIPGATNAVLSVTEAGSYTLVVNQNGCTGTSAQQVIQVSPAPSAVVTAGGPLIFCEGASVSLDGAAGTGNNFQWIKDNVALPGATNALLTVSENGVYQLQVTTGGCASLSGPVTVEVLPSPVITVDTIVPAYCGEDNGSANLFISNAGGNVTYLWNTGSFIKNLKNVAPGNYQITVTGGNACTSTATIEVPDIPAPQPEITGPDEVKPGERVILNTTIPYAGYLWSTTDVSPAIEVAAAGIYTVTVTDTNDCTATASKTIKTNLEQFLDGIDEVVPKAFTPFSSQDKNDGFDPVSILKKNGWPIPDNLPISMTVYARNGEAIARLFPYPEGGWSGDLVDPDLDEGAYYYVLEFFFLDGEKAVYKAVVNLVR